MALPSEPFPPPVPCHAFPVQKGGTAVVRVPDLLTVTGGGKAISVEAHCCLTVAIAVTVLVVLHLARSSSASFSASAAGTAAVPVVYLHETVPVC